MYLSPVFQENQFTDNVEFLVGGLLWTYKAGTSEFALTYQDQAGTTPWPNPIILNSRGETGGELWLSSDNEYRLVVETAPEYGQTHGVVITEFDNVSGVNAPATESADNWVLFPESPNYISTSSFTVAGDYRSIFVVNRKLQITDSGGVSVHSVTSSSFATGFTTVNITGLTDSGISIVEYSNIVPDASPDRFTDLTLNGDLTVGDGAVIDGNLVVGGNTTLGGLLNSVAMSSYWNNSNNLKNIGAGQGYQRFNSGILVQWGTAGTGTAATTVTLPTTFANDNYVVVCTCSNGPGNLNAVVSATSRLATSFNVYTYDSAGTGTGTYITYIAIGQNP